MIYQDLLRESGGFAAVLSRCGTDLHNPLVREWAILCVRNACENNQENQKFIEELQPQEAIIQDENLKAQGYRIEVDHSKGKFELKKD